MSALRATAIALRSELASRSVRGTALLLIALGASSGLRADGAEARGIFAYGILPLAAALFAVRTALDRASRERCGALDVERLYGGGPLALAVSRVTARAVSFTLVSALALSALELGLELRGRGGAEPVWTAFPFEELARKRLVQEGDAASLPPFDLASGSTLVLPLRWRGEEAGAHPVRLAVLLRDASDASVEEHLFSITSSVPLRLRSERDRRCDALLVHHGGGGELRLDIPLAAIERAKTTHAIAAGTTIARLSCFGLAFAAVLSALAAWLRPSLALGMAAVLLPWLLLDPAQALHEHTPCWPNGAALLQLGAWAASRPAPLELSPCWPFAAVAGLGIGIAALAEARRRSP